MEFTPGGDAVKIAEITTKDLDVTQAQLEWQWQSLRGLIPILKEVYCG